MASLNLIETQLKELIISELNLEDYLVEDIDSQEPLFGDGLALDSIDALELGIAIKKKFGISINVDENISEHFYSVEKLAKYISQTMPSGEKHLEE